MANSAIYIAVAHNTTPFITVLPWSNSTGFGTKVTNPATLPIGSGNKVNFTPSNNFIGVTQASSPFIHVYPWAGAFGTKVTDPVTAIPGTFGQDVHWNPAETYISIVFNGTPFVHVYEWTNGLFGSKITNPGTLPADDSLRCHFSPNGDFIAITDGGAGGMGVGSPFIQVYPWTGVFGTKIANPATLPPGRGRQVQWTPNQAAIGMAADVTPFVIAWPWTGAFGTKYADPSTIGTSQARAFCYPPSGTFAAFNTGTSSPFFRAYTWTDASGFGALQSNPGTLPAGEIADLEWGPDELFIAAAMSVTPFVQAWAWSASGFGTKVTDPTALAGAGNGVAWTNPRFIITGTSRDVYGSPLGGVTVRAFLTSNDVFQGSVVSNADGSFILSVGTSGAHYLVAYKAMSPTDIEGVTVNTLTPV